MLPFQWLIGLRWLAPSRAGGCHRVSARGASRPEDGRLLLCDRDPKWSRAVKQWLATAGVRVVRTPPRAPNCNAYAERFVRSEKEECLDRIVPLGKGHLRRTMQEFACTTTASGIIRGLETS